MKEIGKLIELLNEYVEKHNKSDLYYTFELEDNGWLFCYDDVTDHKGWTMQDEAMVICSKKFGFIKWLVENDKIDLDTQAMQYAKSDLSKFFTEWKDKNGMSDDYAMLLMLLSIQDEPINFLISILK